MESESERHAAEMLPGRIVNRLIHRELQEERAWPSEDGRKTPRPPVPTVLVMFIHEIISELGVVVDDALDKRLKVFKINSLRRKLSLKTCSTLRLTHCQLCLQIGQ